MVAVASDDRVAKSRFFRRALVVLVVGGALTIAFGVFRAHVLDSECRSRTSLPEVECAPFDVFALVWAVFALLVYLAAAVPTLLLGRYLVLRREVRTPGQYS